MDTSNKSASPTNDSEGNETYEEPPMTESYRESLSNYTHNIIDHVITAGSTMPMGPHPDFKSNPQTIHTNCWTYCDHSSFSLRTGPNYKRNKTKSPSAKEFYEVIGVDFVKCNSRVDNFGSKVKIPEYWLYPEEIVGPLGMPSLFIVNVQLPANFKTSFFSAAVDDGEGWSLVFYFRLTEETIMTLQQAQSSDSGEGSEASAPVPNALRLLQRYLQHAPGQYETFATSDKNPWNGRFKVTVRLENIDEFGLPSFITGYNAKPVLIRNTGTLCRGPGYVEMDINVHKFSSLPKQALATMFDRFDRMFISVGFCVESLVDEEMPETLLGAVTLLRPTHALSPLFTPKATPSEDKKTSKKN